MRCGGGEVTGAMLTIEQWQEYGVSEVYELVPGRAYEVSFNFVVTRVWIARALHNPTMGFYACWDELIKDGTRDVWTRAVDVPHATDDDPAKCLREALMWMTGYLKERGRI